MTRQRAVKTSSGRAAARGTGGLPALAPEGDLGSDIFCQALGASCQALAALIPDDVFISVSPYGGQSCIIELHSQSRIGQADFDVNPNRLDGIYSALTGSS